MDSNVNGGDKSKDKQEKSPRKRRHGFRFSEQFGSLKDGGKGVGIAILVAILFMFAACVAVFFTMVQGAERVLVPDVEGMPLADALLELQERELYPRISLEYTESGRDKGVILSQNPPSGSIVKAYRRVNLTVSRGSPVEYIEDYTGRDVGDAVASLSPVITNSSYVIEIAPPVYRSDESAEGTILEQDPAPGTAIERNTTIQFVASAGPEPRLVRVPDIQGFTIQQFLDALENFDVAFDFTMREDDEAPAGGAISQSTAAGASVAPGSRIDAVLSVRPASADDERGQGLFSVRLPDYPYPVSMRIESQNSEGDTTLASFSHPGGSFTVPYDAPHGTTLVLYVLGREYARHLVE